MQATKLTPSLAVLGLAAALAGASFAQCTKPCFATFDDNVVDRKATIVVANSSFAVRIRPRNTIQARRLELFTGLVSGASAIEVWSNNAKTNLPDRKLTGASYSQLSRIGWQGATLPQPFTLQANTSYWFNWLPLNGSLGSIRSTNQGQQFATRIGNGAWFGPYVQFEHKLRIYCCVRGSFVTFGNSCGAQGRQPQISGGSSLPRVGQSYQVAVSATTVRAPARLVLGLSNLKWAGLTLPLALGPFGAQGCNIYCSTEVEAIRLTDNIGSTRFIVPVPNSAQLVGLVMYHQWWILASSHNKLGIAFSPAAQVTIGS